MIVSADFLPPSGNTALSIGSEKQFWKELYVGTGSVNFIGNTPTGPVTVAALRAGGENDPAAVSSPRGMVYVAFNNGVNALRGSFAVWVHGKAWGTGSLAQGVTNALR